MLDDYDAALESMNEFGRKPAGTLRVTVAPPAADFILSQAVPRFLALNLEISLDITDIVAAVFDAASAWERASTRHDRGVRQRGHTARRRA